MSLWKIKNLDESNHKPSKILVDKGSEFYNKSVKLCLQDDDIEMYSTHNEVQSVVPKKMIRILKIF